MRYLGYGVGHKGQPNSLESLTTDGDDDCLEEDRLDLKNMERIARDQSLQHGTEEPDDTSEENCDSDFSSESDD